MGSIDHEHRILFARNTRFVIVLIVTGLAVAFTWLQVKDVSIEDFVNPVASSVIWRGALIAYFWCWRFGCIFDTDIQELAYEFLPDSGRWCWQSYGMVVLLIIAAGALVWSYGDVEWSAVTITLFFLIDHAGWRYLLAKLAPSARKSEQAFKERADYFALERLHVVRSQIGGDWKWWRFAAGGVIIVLIDLCAFVEPVRIFLISVVRQVQPGLSTSDAATYTFSLLILLFVAVMEIWHYAIRLRTRFRLDYLGDVRSRYLLQKR